MKQMNSFEHDPFLTIPDGIDASIYIWFIFNRLFK